MSVSVPEAARTLSSVDCCTSMYLLPNHITEEPAANDEASLVWGTCKRRAEMQETTPLHLSMVNWHTQLTYWEGGRLQR